MNIKTIIQITKDEQLKRCHIKHENAKGLITSTEGFWAQTEYPIIAVEKRKVSSKRIPHMRFKDEKMVEIACLIYERKFDKNIVDKTLSVKEIIDELCSFDNADLDIYYYPNIQSDQKEQWWYFKCIDMSPSDNYDCRCENIRQFFKGYHTEGFFA